MAVDLELDEAWTGTPSFKHTKSEANMLDLVKQGATPENASIAAGIGDKWRTSKKFAAYINKVHAHNTCLVEIATNKMMRDGKTMPTGHQFFLKAVAGWHDKYGEDGFAQNITIEFVEVDGTVSPEDDAA